jgi:glyoxylase-like metal-dependent hydrolase (beta-lactamase superfamily II)
MRENFPMAHATELMADLAFLRTLIVNVFFVGERHESRRWVLVDTGVPHVDAIRDAAEERYGSDARPTAIILTHGHFDHVGSARTLVEQWDVPIYAHEEELPFLTGEEKYPPFDPLVGGGMALTSPLFPRGPVDLRPHIRSLPADGSVPGMPNWRWLHTPGHTPGHISLFRDADRTLIAGDAFVTTKQESAYSVLLQREEVHGPPKYATTDWLLARASVDRLARLRPELAATGHGVPMWGSEMRDQLDRLVANFDDLAVPQHGRYVHDEDRPLEH